MESPSKQIGSSAIMMQNFKRRNSRQPNDWSEDCADLLIDANDGAIGHIQQEDDGSALRKLPCLFWVKIDCVGDDHG